MATLVFQFHIMQWHKGQRSPQETQARAETITRHQIVQAPKYTVFDKPCIIDQHGDDTPSNKYPNGRITTAVLADGRLKIDRFYIGLNNSIETLSYADKDAAPHDIGQLNNGWTQASYDWRYPVETDGEIYWLYEQVTLNAALIDKADRDYFTAAPFSQHFLDSTL